MSEIQELADTVLYELAIETCKDVTRNKNNPGHYCHKLNSKIYSEFWRREKAKYYYEAYNRVNEKNPMNFVL